MAPGNSRILHMRKRVAALDAMWCPRDRRPEDFVIEDVEVRLNQRVDADDGLPTCDTVLAWALGRAGTADSVGEGVLSETVSKGQRLQDALGSFSTAVCT